MIDKKELAPLQELIDRLTAASPPSETSNLAGKAFSPPASVHTTFVRIGIIAAAGFIPC